VKSLLPLFVIVPSIFLCSCATQNNQSSTRPATYSITGMVSDLATGNTGGLVLQNNGADNLSVAANGRFQFATAIAKGTTYSVSVLTQPSGPPQQCSVTNGSGTAIGNVSNITIECGHNEWAWMSGSQSVNQLSTYGTQGTPNVANTPSGRQYPATWTDSSGDLWLFGGYGKDSNGVLLPMNDLWRFSSGQWTWIAGPTIGGQSGNYGTLSVATPNGIPGARFEAVTWVDASGDFWLFGGLGFDSVGHEADLNDLWKYSAGEWTWVGGSALTNHNGVYGTLGVADPSNTPGARNWAVVWVDSSGDVWLFGGLGYDGSSTTSGMLNDLWKYSAGQWTWMAGSKVTNQVGVYGTQGTATPSNVPGARYGMSSWTDASGNLWLFGGVASTAPATSGLMNDVWKYSGGQWTWMGGPNLMNQAGVYGTKGVASANSVPGARQFGFAWTDASGKGWLFGGNGYSGTGGVGQLNDLWVYSNGQWTWVGGSNAPNQTSTFGMEGFLDPANAPGGRVLSTGWTDLEGNLWLFGGYGNAPGTTGNLNDLWMYMP
jgi:N-acetylneuraminic acid mutarotase